MSFKDRFGQPARKLFCPECKELLRNVSDFTEVGVRAEGGRTQKPAQAGGGTQRCGTA